jgi:hypothetical protein
VCIEEDSSRKKHGDELELMILWLLVEFFALTWPLEDADRGMDSPCWQGIL